MSKHVHVINSRMINTLALERVLDVEWNEATGRFVLTEMGKYENAAELTPHSLIELGAELIEEGTRRITPNGLR